jgi:hypothetical protein
LDACQLNGTASAATARDTDDVLIQIADYYSYKFDCEIEGERRTDDPRRPPRDGYCGLVQTIHPDATRHLDDTQARRSSTTCRRSSR